MIITCACAFKFSSWIGKEIGNRDFVAGLQMKNSEGVLSVARQSINP